MKPTLRIASQGDIVVVYEATSGRWFVASGPAFPSYANPLSGFPRPHDGALYFRYDLDSWYTWDEPTRAWVISGGGVPGSLTVQEADGAPTVTDVVTLQFNQATGMVVSEPAPGAALVALSGVPESVLALNFATHSSANDPTAGEKAALPGTSGAAGAGNKYVTDADARNTNARTPVAHTHIEGDVTGLVADLAAKALASRLINTTAPVTGGGDLSADRTIAVSAATTAAVGVVELATSGEVAANVVVQGNDARLSDSRTPLAHKASHQDAGSDEISVLGLSGLLADQQTPLTHDIITKHNGFPGGSTNFLRGDGTFAAPTASVALSVAEVSLLAAPDARRSGKVQITGLSGLTIGKPVYIQQAVGPYTGKGTRADEAEMDQLTLTAVVLSATVIDVYWKSIHRTRGNFKLNYLVGA